MALNLQPVEVSFEFKRIAELSGLKFNTADHKWYGNKSQIAVFESNKEKELKIHNATKRATYITPTLFEFNNHTVCHSDAWIEIFSNFDKITNLELIKTIHDYSMPEEPLYRIRILRKFSTKIPGEYPVYYDDLIFYSDKFKSVYPREYVNYLLGKYNITGQSLKEEIEASEMNEEEKALIYFVLSQE